MKNLKFAVSLALFALSVPAWATSPLKPFSYRLKLPTDGTTCSDHAKQVANSFSTLARVHGVSGLCWGQQSITDDGTQYQLDIVVINYQAESEMTPDRAVFGGNEFQGRADAEAGLFKTYAECMSVRAAQLPIFASETGLAPLAAYCTPSNKSFYPGFTLSIESFGEAKRRLYSFSQDGMGRYGEDQTQVIQAAKLAIQSDGGRVVWSNENRLFYYGEYQTRVAVQTLAYFSDAKQCDSQLAQARAIFAQAGLAGLSTFCEVSRYAPAHESAALTIVGAGQNEVQDMTLDHYDSFEECRADLPRVLQNQVSAGRHLFGGICVPSLAGQSGYNADVFFGYY